LYFRLKQTDFDGATSYSSIVSVEVSAPESNWTVFPNPVTQKEFTVEAGEKIISQVVLLDPQSGRELFRQEFSVTNTDLIHVALPESVATGLYILSIQHENGVETKPLMVY